MNNDWIRVEDRTPATEDLVIIYCKREYEDSKEVIVGQFDQAYKYWYSSHMREDEDLNVSHWHPLPSPPQS